MEKLYEKDRFEAMTVSENADNVAGETSNRPNISSGDETNQTTENRKRKEREGSSSEPLNESEDESYVQKKKRVIWTSEMHRKFVDAIAQIGEDRAFPKKIVEVMNEPGLTRENVASHLQKYRICLKKSQEERDRYFQGLNAATVSSKAPYIYGPLLGNCQQQYLGTSQLASVDYPPISSSSNSSLYGIRTGIGASRVRLAPPSYSSFDVSSLPINTRNLQNQCSRRTIEVNKIFPAYGDDEERNMSLSILNKRPCSYSSDDPVTSSSTSNSAFMGLRIANDGRSIFFGGPNRSEIISTENFSTKRNDFHYQESAAPLFPGFNIESYAQDSPLPPLPDSEDHLEEPSWPPLPEFYDENSLLQLEPDDKEFFNCMPDNEFINCMPQQEIYFGTSLTDDINSFSSRHTTGTSLDQQNSLQSVALEILENTEMEQVAQVFANNHTVNSLPPITSPWNTYTNMASNPLINQEDSLPPLPSEVPWNLYLDSTTSNLIPQTVIQHSLLPPLPSESQWNVNPDDSTMPVGKNILDEENLLPCSPSEIPWDLDSDPVPQTYNGNFFDEQNIVPPLVSDQTPGATVQNLSTFHVNMR